MSATGRWTTTSSHSALRIAITLDARALQPAAPADVAGVLEAVEAVERALLELGHECRRVAVAAAALAAPRQLFADAVPDLVFNLCESVNGSSAGEARLIAALELAGIPVTGAPAETVTLARRKDCIGSMLSARGTAVPRTAIVDAGQATALSWNCYPCIVKPAAEDGSVGITQLSVVRNAAELERAITAAQAHAPLLVQEFLPGRELNVAIVGDVVLPISEIEYQAVPDGLWPIVDYSAKWECGSAADRMTVPRCPALIDATMADQARELATRVWRLVGGAGAGRIDLRVDAQGRLHLLEINPNPDLAPGAGLARMAAAHGWSYRELVAQLVEDALQRAAGRTADTAVARVTSTTPVPTARAYAARTALRIEPLPARVRPQIERILTDTGVFRADEIGVALEVIDSYFADPARDYTALGAFTRDGELIGYSCHGPTPCTLGTYDLYWIAVAPAAQRAGAGSALLQEVERRLAEADARMLLIETSSQPQYRPTRAFYERHGYREVARVPDFYAPGDDRVIFAKRIPTARRG